MGWLDDLDSQFQLKTGMEQWMAPPPPPEPAQGGIGAAFGSLAAQAAAARPPAPTADAYRQNLTRQAGGMGGALLQQADSDRQEYIRAGTNKIDAEQAAAEERNRMLGPAYQSDQQAFQDDYRQKQERDVAIKERAALFQQKATALAAEEIDPLHFFNQMKTWQKIVLTISMGIGGYLNPRGKNHIADLVMQYVQNDIDAQKATKAGKMKALDAEREGLRDDVADSKQEFAEQELHRMKALELAIREVDVQAAQHNSPVAQANRSMAIAELRLKAGEEYRKIAGQLLNYDLGLRQVGARYAEIGAENKRHDADWAQRQQVQDYNIAYATPRKLDQVDTKIQAQKVGRQLLLRDPENGEAIGYYNPKAMGDSTNPQEWLIAARGAKASMQYLMASEKDRSFMENSPEFLARVGIGSDKKLDASAAWAELIRYSRVLENSGKAWTGNEERIAYKGFSKGPSGWVNEDPTPRMRRAIKDLERAEHFMRRSLFGPDEVDPTPGIEAPSAIPSAEPQAPYGGVPFPASPTSRIPRYDANGNPIEE